MDVKEQMQEIFETVIRHLLTQGQPAVNQQGRCLYRTEDGLKCAVGCLIPDELYDPRMEGHGMCAAVFGKLPLGCAELPIDFFVSLQRIHDNSAELSMVARSGNKEIFCKEVLSRAKAFAYRYELNGSFLGQL